MPKLTAMCLGLLALTAPATAQTVWDYTLHYEARDTLQRPADGGGLDGWDNDRFLGRIGATWTRPDGGTRVALTFGVRNEDFSGSYPEDLSAEAIGYRLNGPFVYGLGIRVGTVGDQAQSAEIGLAAEYQTRFATLRGLAGVQALSEDWPNSEDPSSDTFLLVETTVYPADWLALRAGASLDSRGDPLGNIGAEVMPFGLPVSFFADWVVSTDEFRQEPFYNDFRFGIQVSFDFGAVRDRDRRQQGRLLTRFVSAQ